MENDQVSEMDASNLAGGGAGDPRQRSTIGFPYADLADVEGVAFAIHSNVAYGTCTDDQLAPWLKLSPKSSGFRIRISAARLFGLVETEGGRHSLTNLGKAIVDPMSQRSARVDSFLRVPLFARVFAEYKGNVLPPAAALERAIEGMGVAPKQKTRARQLLERSADQAGFFEQGKGRLVKPGVVDGPPATPPPGDTGDQQSADKGREDRAGDGGQPPLDDLIKALVARIPRDKTWKGDERATWLKTAVMVFDLVYGPAPGISVGDPKVSTADA